MRMYPFTIKVDKKSVNDSRLTVGSRQLLTGNILAIWIPDTPGKILTFFSKFQSIDLISKQE